MRQRNRLRRLAFGVESLENRQLLSTFAVNTTSYDSTDQSVLTFRDAIELADGTMTVGALSDVQQLQVTPEPFDQSVITFNIPGDAPYIISPTSALPEITTKVTINGYTQPGASVATNSTPANIPVILDGSKVAANIVGLYISSPGTSKQLRLIGLSISLILEVRPGWTGSRYS